jgi:DNA modification methylase
MSNFTVKTFADGIVVHGDCTDQSVVDYAKQQIGVTNLILTDPPYNGIVSERWDNEILDEDKFVSWMVDWTRQWSSLLDDRAACYVWGGIGKPGNRSFFKYISAVEEKKKFEMSSLITWKKKRAIGTASNYLFTREELAYFVKGIANKPKIFNVPLLSEKRGYAGFNKKYPAKSEFYRRSNVWTDINEIFRNKIHPTQKPVSLFEIPIEVHTNVGDWIIDPFAGSGVAAFAARNKGRKFFLVEKDESYFNNIVNAL